MGNVFERILRKTTGLRHYKCYDGWAAMRSTDGFHVINPQVSAGFFMNQKKGAWYERLKGAALTGYFLL